MDSERTDRAAGVLASACVGHVNDAVKESPDVTDNTPTKSIWASRRIDWTIPFEVPSPWGWDRRVFRPSTPPGMEVATHLDASRGAMWDSFNLPTLVGRIWEPLPHNDCIEIGLSHLPYWKLSRRSPGHAGFWLIPLPVVDFEDEMNEDFCCIFKSTSDVELYRDNKSTILQLDRRGIYNTQRDSDFLVKSELQAFHSNITVTLSETTREYTRFIIHKFSVMSPLTSVRE